MSFLKKFFSVTKESIIAKALKSTEKSLKVILTSAIAKTLYFEEQGKDCSKYDFHSGLIKGRLGWKMDSNGVLYNKGTPTPFYFWHGYDEYVDEVDKVDERTISELLELKKEEFLESELASETVPILTEVMTFEFEKWWNEDKPWFEYALAEIGNVAMEQAPIALRKFWQSYQD